MLEEEDRSQIGEDLYCHPCRAWTVKTFTQGNDVFREVIWQQGDIRDEEERSAADFHLEMN